MGVCLILLTSGCMAVLGYEPTPAELEMIRRGEDPRANEDEARDTTGNAGEGETRPGEPEQPRIPRQQQPGPAGGTVLRWMDSATVVVEVNDEREVVRLAGERPRDSAFDEQVALDDHMNKWTYGAWVRLSYPLRGDDGSPIYRDAEGRLLATID